MLGALVSRGFSLTGKGSQCVTKGESISTSCSSVMPLLPSRLFCSNEDEGEGFVLNGDGIGLRLTAMEYWKCGEAGMKFSFTDKKEPECKFVVAESLPGQGKTLLLRGCVCV